MKVSLVCMAGVYGSHALPIFSGSLNEIIGAKKRLLGRVCLL